ncbi:hypothetical protein AB0L63_02940 [Nocardia sp. NPDC051990]|uniref:hypothetical protein n=1 Tax=Nocardia sp. NPDC051990 TaxID=3155285 RepID=UPI00341AF164
MSNDVTRHIAADWARRPYEFGPVRPFWCGQHLTALWRSAFAFAVHPLSPVSLDAGTHPAPEFITGGVGDDVLPGTGATSSVIEQPVRSQAQDRTKPIRFRYTGLQARDGAADDRY